ncbi:hypothetical protein FCH79_00410 [Pseudomonas koreensis]|nr:hypothetical protein [Pseudomonas koreensis]
MATPAARITDPASCPIPGHAPKAIASGFNRSAPLFSPATKICNHCLPLIFLRDSVLKNF